MCCGSTFYPIFEPKWTKIATTAHFCAIIANTSVLTVHVAMYSAYKHAACILLLGNLGATT